MEASAGTGKTTELVARIVHVLASGVTTIDNIVAVTFTNKAAGELKLRLRQELDRARELASSPAERANVEDALEHLEEASIGTIHSFCAQILRERPVEAIVDPAFEELTEQQSARIFERAFRAWFQQKLAEGAPGLRRALARLAWRESCRRQPADEPAPIRGRKLIEWRDFPGAWRQPPFDRSTEIDQLIEQIKLVAEARPVPQFNDNLVRSLRPAQALVTWIERAESHHARARLRHARKPAAEAAARPEARYEERLRLLRRRRAARGSGGSAHAIARDLDAFRSAPTPISPPRCAAEMWDLVDRYNERKRAAGKLDFVDLLILARDLVRINREVRDYLQQRFTHIFVDEFQDTDPLQAEILLLLAAEDAGRADWLQVTPKPGKLFVVGDPKQSIYKFRRADVVLYRAIRDALETRGVGAPALTTSFRARAHSAVRQQRVSSEMQDDAQAGQAAYSPLDRSTPPIEGQPA